MQHNETGVAQHVSRIDIALWLLALTGIVSMMIIINIAPLTGLALSSKGELYLSPFDILLPIGLILIMIFRWKTFRSALAGFPWILAAFVIYAVISVIPIIRTAGDTGIAQALLKFGKKGVMNIGLFMVLAPLFWMAVNASSEERWGKIMDAAFIASGYIVIYGWIDYFTTHSVQIVTETGKTKWIEAFPFDVGANLINYNRLGMFLAMMVPFAAAAAVFRSDRRTWVRILYGSLAAGGLLIILQGGALIGAIAGVAAIVSLISIRRSRLIVAATLAAVVLLIALAPVGGPARRTNLQTAIESLRPMKENPVEKSVFGDPVFAPSERTRRWMRVMDAVEQRPMLGYGVGRYYDVIIHRAGYPPDYAKGSQETDDRLWFDIETNEKNGFGLYEVTAVETGVVGLLLIFSTFVYLIVSGIRRFATSSDSGRWLIAGGVGSMVAVIIASIYLDPLMRGVGGWLSIALAVLMQGERTGKRTVSTAPAPSSNTTSTSI